MRKFSALARKTGVKQYVLFNNVFDYYINFNWPAPSAVDFGIVSFNHATYDLFSLNGVVACKDLLEEIPRYIKSKYFKSRNIL